MEENKKIEEVKTAIAKIRPYIQRYGGDVSLSRLEDDIVYVKVHGSCLGCSVLDVTLKEGIEAIILDEVEGIKEVRLDENDPYEGIF